MSEPDRTLRLKVSYDFPGSFTTNGAERDMTGLVGRLRLLHDDGTTTITRLTSDSDQWTWTDQTKGTGTWHWESDESFTTGHYTGQVYTEDASTPIERDLTNDDEEDGQFFYTFIDPETGAFS